VRIRTLLVDDEPLARQRLRALLARDDDIDLFGECGDGGQAVAAVQNLHPDLLFLDVQMPVLDGFGVLESLAGMTLPVVVFVTAHDRFALKAFEVHALDYLLKPFDKDRFGITLQRAKAQVALGRTAALENNLRALLQTVHDKRVGPDRLVVKSGGRISFIRVEDIDWIEAAGNYVKLHVGKEDHLLRESLGSLEARLDPSRFVRIHRSTIVRLERIRELQPAFHGDYHVLLHDGTELTMSRSCREKLQQALGHEL
jgi:two-component system LytT family response regulator